MSNPVKHRGVVFETGDSHLIIPSISCGQADALADALDKNVTIQPLPENPSDEQKSAYRKAIRDRRAAWMEVITAAVQRNYSQMTPEQVADALSEEHIREAFLAASGVDSGVVGIDWIQKVLDSSTPDQAVASFRAVATKRQRVKDPEELAPAPGPK